jgi:signal transduction histidine kinase
VSDIRDKSKIDLKAALLALTENLPNLKIDLNIDEELNIDNVGLADGIIKTIQECITNTMKHGQADKMEIKLQQEAHSLSINVKDNGKATPETQVKLGNGLLGIRERIEAFAGSVEFIAENGFTTHITLPLVTDYNKIEQGRLMHE